jgi:hypothetical protein
MKKFYLFLLVLGVFPSNFFSILLAQSPNFELGVEPTVKRLERSKLQSSSYSFRPNPRNNYSENPHPEEGLFVTKYGGVELIGKRDLFSKTFQNPDGTFGRLQSRLPMHYKDEHGNWLTYSENFGKIEEQKYGLLHTDIPVFLHLASGQTIMGLDNQGQSLIFTSEFSMSYEFNDQNVLKTPGATTGNIKIHSSENEVIWKNAWSSVDRRQKIFLYDVETDYIIQEKPLFAGQVPEKLIFTEKIILPQGWKISYGEGKQTPIGWQGALMLSDKTGTFRATFEEPIYYDSPTSGKAQVVQGAYTFIVNDNILELSVVVDMNWLLNTNLSYPVIIDPLVSNFLSSDRNVGPTSGATPSCQHTMNVNVPAGIISMVQTTFPMEARNNGYRSEQRVRFAFNNNMSGDLGPACNVASGGTCDWVINGAFSYAHPGGNIPMTLQPWKTWASNGQDACNQYNQRVRSNWTVYVGYAIQTGNEIVFDWVGNREQLYIVPDGYCQAEIELWGAGGGGGGVYSGWLGDPVRGGGGGGGAYARTTVPVEDGYQLFIYVGEGGAGGSAGTWLVNPTDGVDGQMSYVDDLNGVLAEAHGGQGGRFRRGDGTNGTKNGAGATTGVNKLFNGGNGGPNQQANGSGGGGGAGNAGHGGNGTGTSFGAGGVAGGGNGANHQPNDANGNLGATPGGGGGGGKNCSNCGGRTGGRGGDGRVIIKLTPNPTDGSLSASTPTTVCLGNSIAVAPSGGYGTPKYWIQSPAGHPTWNLGVNQAPNTTGNGYTFTPTTVGTYRIHARWENECGFCWDIPGHDWGNNNKCPQFAYVDFEVVAPSVAPTGINVTGLPVCHGGKIDLSVVGGNLSSGAQWEWFSSSCGSSVIGTGATIEVSPNGTTNYLVRASAGTGCPASTCQSITVNMPNPGTSLSLDGDQATCKVNVNGWVHFYNNNGLLIASVKSNSQNLGDVTARSYVAATPYLTTSCTEPNNASFYQTVLQRSFVIEVENQPTSPVQVRLYVLNSEVSAYQTAALATTQNPNDDIPNGIQNLHLTKISNGADTGDPNDFCGSGGTGTYILHDAHGDINNLSFSGFTATSYLEFTIDSFSEFFIMNSNNSPLPVSLTQFSANCIQDKIAIFWQTASEFNASHYILQSSRDGHTWFHLAQIQATGTTNQTSEYSFIDQNFGNLTYYRLVQVDHDGEQTIYGPISSNCNSQVNQMTVHPNPTSDYFTIVIQSTESIENAQLEVVDMSGRVLANQTKNIEAGTSMLGFNVQTLHSGTYMIVVKGQNDKFSPIRVVKL